MKQKLLFAISVIFCAGILSGRYSRNPQNITQQGGFPSIAYEQMCFAQECIPYDGQYYFNKARIDRELAITLLNEEQFIMYHRREPQYFPYIREELQKAGLPQDLVYLAVAESGLRDTAVSVAGAAGVWQFMPATARSYGLRVDDQVDERLDLEKSTQAAIAYLSKAYDRFGSWTLAAAAYNRGSTGLQNALSAQGVESYYDVHLNNETARYVYRIIAIKYLMENRTKYFPSEALGQQYAVPPTKSYRVGQADDLIARALENNTTYRHIRKVNPRIIGTSLPEGEWEIKVIEG